jgi:hypothetical protein
MNHARQCAMSAANEKTRNIPLRTARVVHSADMIGGARCLSCCRVVSGAILLGESSRVASRVSSRTASCSDTIGETDLLGELGGKTSHSLFVPACFCAVGNGGSHGRRGGFSISALVGVWLPSVIGRRSQATADSEPTYLRDSVSA